MSLKRGEASVLLKNEVVVQTGLLKVKLVGSKQPSSQTAQIVQIISLLAHTKLETFNLTTTIGDKLVAEHQLTAYFQKLCRLICQRQIFSSIKTELAPLLGFKSAAIYIKDGLNMYNVCTEDPLEHTVKDFVVDKQAVVTFPATWGFNGAALSNNAVLYLNADSKGPGLQGEGPFYSKVYSLGDMRIPVSV